MSNAPTVLFGLMPLARAVVRSATSGALTTNVEADDSGTLFVSLTSGTHNYVLPVVSECAGKFFIFYDAEGTAAITITGGTTDKIMGVDDAGCDTVYDDDVLGSWGMIVGDGTYYYFIAGAGTWSKTT